MTGRLSGTVGVEHRVDRVGGAVARHRLFHLLGNGLSPIRMARSY